MDSPTQTWISGWVDFLGSTVPLMFLVAVVGAGLVIMVRKGNKKKGIPGGMRAAVVFGLGAALVYLLLTNLEVVSSLFGEELPIND